MKVFHYGILLYHSTCFITQDRAIYSFYFHHLRLPSELEIATIAGNTTAATTQIIQLYPQLFVEKLYPKYTAVTIDQYTTEIAVVADCFSFFSFE